MLFCAATEITDWADFEKAGRLFKKGDFISMIWKAAVIRPLNRRTVGGLEPMRRRIVDRYCTADPNLLVPPVWWKEMLKDLPKEAVEAPPV
jgi:hypothetical protein